MTPAAPNPAAPDTHASVYALKPGFQDLLRPLARRLDRWGVSANQVTVAAGVASIAIGATLVAAPRPWFLLLPAWMAVRMALNAVDGLMARELGHASALGAYLNELADVVADAALYLPFAFVTPFGWRSVGAVILASTLTEMAGVVGVVAGGTRRYDGPMGKSDRAVCFSMLAIWVALTAYLPTWAGSIPWLVAGAAAWTIVNRVRAGLRELDALDNGLSGRNR